MSKKNVLNFKKALGMKTNLFGKRVSFEICTLSNTSLRTFRLIIYIFR